jgi:hypothetical protein
MATIRFDDSDQAAAAFAKIREKRSALAEAAKLPRISGVHLCTTNSTASAARTAESRDRTDIMPAPIGALLLEGCDEAAVQTAVAQVLKLCGAQGPQLPVGFYRLEHARSNVSGS